MGEKGRPGGIPSATLFLKSSQRPFGDKPMGFGQEGCTCKVDFFFFFAWRHQNGDRASAVNNIPVLKINWEGSSFVTVGGRPGCGVGHSICRGLALHGAWLPTSALCQRVGLGTAMCPHAPGICHAHPTTMLTALVFESAVPVTHGGSVRGVNVTVPIV